MHSPLPVGKRKQLFIDHRFIQSRQNVELVVNPPEKLEGAVLKSDRPWEQAYFTYLSIIEDEGGFRMWYQALDVPHWWEDTSKVCYAESEDGRHWHKPSLGLVEYQGSKDNNILIDGGIDCRLAYVFKDPHDADEGRRYKMLYGYGRTSMRTSPDGIHWSPSGPILWDYPFDTQKQAWWDEDLGRYVIYVRGQVAAETSDPNALSFPFVEPIPSAPPVVAPTLYRPIRMLARLETDDILQPWPAAACRTVLCGDQLDPPETDIYHPGGVYKYPFADDAYFMFPWVYEQWPHSPHSNDGVVNAQFAASRDGWHWMRYDRQVFIAHGEEGEFDYGCAEPLGPFFRDGDALYQYYSGWQWTHGGGRFRRRDPAADDPANWNWRQCRLNKYRLDGFVSADAPPEGGRLCTPPLFFEGDHLELNIQVADGGRARLALLDPDGRPLPGYALEDCNPIGGDAVARLVKWQDKAALTALTDRPVRLQFDLSSTKLYAFQFL